MMRKKLLMVLFLLVGAGLLGRTFCHRQQAAADDPSLLLNRLWLDHMPLRDTEMIDVVIAFGAEREGVFTTQSFYQGTWERYRFKLEGKKLIAKFPQTGKELRMEVDARECKERGFDFCLDLKGGPKGD